MISCLQQRRTKHMSRWFENLRTSATRRLIVPVVAAVMDISLGTYQFAKPANAAAAAPAPAPAAAGLDDDSVGALLSLDKAMESLAARVTPAIVNVTVTSKTNAQMSDSEDGPDMQQFGPFGGQFGMPGRPQPRIEHGLGSGVIISPDGYIVTNNHVVDGAVDINVTMSDKRVFPAKLIGTDPLTDLAVVKINGSGFASVPLGDSTKLHPGQSVLAFGNPLGMRF